MAEHGFCVLSQAVGQAAAREAMQQSTLLPASEPELQQQTQYLQWHSSQLPAPHQQQQRWQQQQQQEPPPAALGADALQQWAGMPAGELIRSTNAAAVALQASPTEGPPASGVHSAVTIRLHA